MFGRIRRFFQRNMGRIVFGVVAVPFFFKLTRYAARQYITYQTQRTHELIRKFKKQQMFEMMEEGFAKTFENWFDVMKKTIKERLNAETYMERLKNGTGDRLENWMELKVVAFSSILSYVYGSAMLTVLLRVQSNVISGLLFKQLEDTPANLDILGGAGDATIADQFRRHMITDEIQEEYMTLTRYLCTEGVTNLCDLMREKCRRIVGSLPLKRKLTVEDVEQLFTAIRSKEISNVQELNDWCPITEAWHYMFSEQIKLQFLYPIQAYPRKSPISEREAFLRTLVGEAYDLVTAEDSRTILKFLETQGINYYLDRISEYINSVPVGEIDSLQSQSSEGGSSSEQSVLDEKNVAVAKLIPTMNSFINVPYSEDLWASLLLHNESLKSFSANVYESYSSKQFD